ncbi:MAG TPA: GNAT family N-acetyltransferase [Longimicrobiales bacterium]|nr:GNAT family N-acetyltransferase [Longimicrobiales bacterium]
MSAFIRLASTIDGPALAAIYRPAVTDTAISFEIDPPDAAIMASRVEKMLARLPWIVCDSAGGVAGYAYASPYRDRPAYQWSVEVSAYVREGVRRSGVARALYASLFEILALQGFRNALAGITLPNEASEGFHRAVGFTPIGVYRSVGYKLGSWHDVGWMERSLAPRDANPQPPLPLPDVIGTQGFREALSSGASYLRAPVA